MTLIQCIYTFLPQLSKHIFVSKQRLSVVNAYSVQLRNSHACPNFELPSILSQKSLKYFFQYNHFQYSQI